MKLLLARIIIAIHLIIVSVIYFPQTKALAIARDDGVDSKIKNSNIETDENIELSNLDKFIIKEFTDNMNAVVKSSSGTTFEITFESVNIINLNNKKTLIVKKFSIKSVKYIGPKNRRIKGYPGEWPKYEKGYMTLDSFQLKLSELVIKSTIERACDSSSKNKDIKQVILDTVFEGGGVCYYGAKMSDYILYKSGTISSEEWKNRMFAF